MAMSFATWLDNRLVRRVAFVAALLTVIMCVGTAGFVLIEGYSVFDAFYMTLITVSTVGYEEVHRLSHAGRVFNSFLIFVGVTAIFLAAGAMTQTIIELEFQDRYGKRKKRK